MQVLTRPVGMTPVTRLRSRWNMNVRSSRRRFIAVALIVAALGGALLRIFSAPQSTTYDLGTLLMVMWVPIVGNIILFLAKKRRSEVKATHAFSAGSPFVPHIIVGITLNESERIDRAKHEKDGKLHCLFVTGTEGFSARVSLPSGSMRSAAVTTHAQFLSPGVALSKFPVGSTFHLVQGERGFGTGQVLSLLERRTS